MSAREGGAADWQPIETAPMDGTPLVLFARCKSARAEVVVIGWFLPNMGWVECAFYPNHPVGLVPSLWMPLPDRDAAQRASYERSAARASGAAGEV